METERLAIIGTSFRRVGFDRLARFVLPPEDDRALEALRGDLGAEELVYVATCNRVECYVAFGRRGRPAVEALRARAVEAFARRSGASIDPESFFALAGRDALAHLFAVAASLDSLVLGECEILGQLRRAADRAAERGLSGRVLRRAFDRAARAAKRVRAETAIGRTPVSVASLASRRIRAHFAAEPPRLAAVVGAGEVARKVAGALREMGAPLLFANRTLERAEELADRFGGTALPLHRFRESIPESLDVVVSATSAPTAILSARELAPALARRAPAGPRSRLLVCDLGLPPDVDPALGARPEAALVALADLEAVARENRARLEGEAARARAIVEEEVEDAVRADRMRALASESVEALLGGRLAHLAAEERETLRRFAVNLADRLARQP